MRKIGVLLATLAGTAVLCAACGGSGLTAGGGGTRPSSPDPRPASAGALGSGASLGSGSEPNPCKLVPLAVVRAVAGDSYSSTSHVSDLCVYASNGGNVVEIAVWPVAYSNAGPLMEGAKPTPFNGLGHPAECGNNGLGPTLVGAIGSSSVVDVLGPSCGVDGKLAQKVYSALAS